MDMKLQGYTKKLVSSNSNSFKQGSKGTAGYDNPRENIDPHIKTKVIDTKEGMLTKTATTSYDIVNKYYADNFIVPIGAILPWLKSFSFPPALPDCFMECNGQAVIDTESVYYDLLLPNLNGNNYFLRGNSSSGSTGGESTHTITTDEMPAHTHAGDGGNFIISAGSNPWRGTTTTALTTAASTASTGGGAAHENKPPYYDVVWIIKIK